MKKTKTQWIMTKGRTVVVDGKLEESSDDGRRCFIDVTASSGHLGLSRVDFRLAEVAGTSQCRPWTTGDRIVGLSLNRGKSVYNRTDGTSRIVGNRID